MMDQQVNMLNQSHLTPMAQRPWWAHRYKVRAEVDGRTMRVNCPGRRHPTSPYFYQLYRSLPIWLWMSTLIAADTYLLKMPMHGILRSDPQSLGLPARRDPREEMRINSTISMSLAGSMKV